MDTKKEEKNDIEEKKHYLESILNVVRLGINVLKQKGCKEIREVREGREGQKGAG